jgi:hypothetical protein
MGAYVESPNMPHLHVLGVVTIQRRSSIFKYITGPGIPYRKEKGWQGCGYILTLKGYRECWRSTVSSLFCFNLSLDSPRPQMTTASEVESAIYYGLRNHPCLLCSSMCSVIAHASLDVLLYHLCKKMLEKRLLH